MFINLEADRTIQYEAIHGLVHMLILVVGLRDLFDLKLGTILLNFMFICSYVYLFYNYIPFVRF